MDYENLRSLSKAAHPRPWAWFGNTKQHNLYLATIHGGRVYVMDFVRWGMGGATPRFQVDQRMVKAEELVVYEVDYRKDIKDINCPDAQYIVAACNAVPALLEEIDQFEAVRARIQKAFNVCNDCERMQSHDAYEAGMRDAARFIRKELEGTK